MIGPTARLLRALAAVDPLYFSSFYRRARLFAERPTPGVATATVDLTTRCPLRCGFCFAAGTQDTGREFSLQDVQALQAQLRGLDKLVLIGGEPLAHPQFRAIAAELGGAHAAVECYTNGLPIPLDANHRDNWLQERFAGRHAHWTLTLAVDRDHQAEMGPAEFARRVDGLLAAGHRLPWLGVRFNVTDPRLHTTGYLAPETVVAVLADLHEPLVATFRTALAAGNLSERFQFNPVVRLGRASEGIGERLKAEDVLFAPELVLSPRDQGLAALRAVPAAWMETPPAPLWHLLAGPAALPEVVRRHWVADRLHADRDPAALALFDDLATADPADPGLAAQLRQAVLAGWLADWPANRDAWMDLAASRLFDLIAEPGVSWDLSADRRVRRLTVPILGRFARLRWALAPHRQAETLARLAQRATEVLARGQVPMFTGYSARPGLLADAPDEPLPLDRTPIDTSPRPPHLGDALLRPLVVPHVWLDADGALDVHLDGVGGVPFGSARAPAEVAEAFAHLFGMVAWLVPDGARADLLAACRAQVRKLGAIAPNPRWARALDACAVIDPAELPAEVPESRADAARLLLGEAAVQLAREPGIGHLLAG